mmetsp:Transcript_9852/g.19362  ORF Transcript_9852/g.19362 Transcript_9852/m.19362 type:complete len:515 (+) Transcript_9852:424-1968(+)
MRLTKPAILVAMCCVRQGLGSIVVSPASAIGLQLETPVFSFSQDEYEVGDIVIANSRVVQLDDAWCHYGCQGPPENYVLSANSTLVQLAYSQECFHCGYAWLALVADKLGAAATLYYSDRVAGHEFRVIHSFEAWRQAEGIPFFELGESGANKIKSLLDAGEEVRVDVVVTSNPWRALFDGPGWITVQVLCSLMSLYVLTLVCMRLSKFAKWYRREGAYKVAVVILSVEFVCNILRLMYTSVDPTWSRAIFTYGVGRLFLTLTVPIGLLSSSLLFLVWNDMLKISHTPHKTLLFHRRSSHIIFIVLAIIFIGFELTMSLLAMYKGLVDLSEAAAIAEASFTLIVGIAVVAVGAKLLHNLKIVTTSKSSRPASPSWDASFPSKDTKDSGMLPLTPRVDTMSSVEALVPQPTSFRLGGDVDGDPPLAPQPSLARSSVGTGSRKKLVSPPQKNLQRLTWKIILTAILLALSAIVIAVAGQAIVLFTPIPRAVVFTFYVASQALRSYFTVSFFDPRNR